jgi:hypothetical protein
MPFIAPVPENTPYRDVANALWGWVSSSAQAWKLSGAHRSICEDFFIKEGPEIFLRVCRERAVYTPGAIEATFHLAPFHSVVAALAAEPDFGPILGKAVGSASHLFPISPDRIAASVVPVDTDYERPTDMQFGEPGRIEKLLRQLHTVVRAATFEVVYVTPIWDLEVATPLELEPGLVIDVLTDDEAIKALQMNAIAGDMAQRRRYKREPYRRLALRRTIALPKLVLDRIPTPEDVLAGRHPGAHEQNGFDDPERLLSLLPLVSTGLAKTGATMTWATIGSPWGIQSVNYLPTSTPGLDDTQSPRPQVTLNDAGAADLVRYWAALRATQAQGPASLALRRLRDAAERRRDADRILDIVIAAEALFLPADGDHTELKFRCSLHAAFYLETELAERRIVYRTVGAAYDMRSAIAHGSEPRAVRVLGEPLTVEALTPRVEEIVRRALQKRLGERQEPDWDALVVGLVP